MADSDPLIGKTLHGFEIIDVIGKGGMATVYKGYQSSLNRTVAIKVLPLYFAHDTEFVRRFMLEARSTAKLGHPNIVTIMDVGEAEGYHFIVMEYLEGHSLKENLEKGPMPEARAWRILGQLASALDYAHARGVVHRDVKPSNIILDDNDHAKLMDFGIAKAVQGTKVTMTGTVIGTPEYMSPEQARGDELDARTDIYSLGVVGYEMLGGRPPFTAATPHAVIHNVIYNDLTPLRQVNPRISVASDKAIMRALAKDPDKRFQTAKEMVAAATGGAETGATFSKAQIKPSRQPKVKPPAETIAALPVGTKPTGRGNTCLLVLGLVTVGLVFLGIAIFLYLQNSSSIPTAPTATVIALAPPSTETATLPPTPTLEPTRNRTAAQLLNETTVASALQTRRAEATATPLPTFTSEPPTATSLPSPTVAPTRVITKAPPPTPTLALPPGVYLTAIKNESPPVRGADLTFRATFINTTNETKNYVWKIRGWFVGAARNSTGESENAPISIPPGTSEFVTPPGWRVSGGGGCQKFFIRGYFVAPDNTETMFRNATPSGEWRYTFDIC